MPYHAMRPEVKGLLGGVGEHILTCHICLIRCRFAPRFLLHQIFFSSYYRKIAHNQVRSRLQLLC